MGVGSLFRRLKLSSKTHSKLKDSIHSSDIENQTGELSQSHHSSQFSDPPLPFPEPNQLGTIDYTTEEPYNNPDHSIDAEKFIVGEIELATTTTITKTGNNSTHTNHNDNDNHKTINHSDNNQPTTTATIGITLPYHTHQNYDPISTPNKSQHSPSSIIQPLLTSDLPSLLVPGDDGIEQHHHDHNPIINDPHISDDLDHHHDDNDDQHLDIGVVYLSAEAADMDQSSLEPGEGSYTGRASSLSGGSNMGGGGMGGGTGLMNVDDAVSVISSMTEDDTVTAAQLGQALEALEEEAFSVTGGDDDNTINNNSAGAGSGAGGGFFSSLTSMVGGGGGGGGGNLGTSPSKEQQQQTKTMNIGVAGSICSVGGEFFLPSQSASLVKLYNNLALKLMDSRRKEKRDYEQAKILLMKAEQLLDNDGAWAISIAGHEDNGDGSNDGGGGDINNYKMVEDEIGERRNRLRAITCNNIGCLMKRQGQPAVALSYLSKALPLEEAAGNVHNACSTLLNICAAMSALKRYKEALSHAERAILLLQHELWGAPSGAVPAGSPTPSFQTGIVHLMRRVAAANIALDTASGVGVGGSATSTTTTTAPEPPATTTSSSSSSTPIISLVQLLAMAYHNAAVEHERLGRLKEAGVSFARAANLADRFMGQKVAMTVSLHKALKGFQSRSASALPPTGLMGGSTSTSSSGALRKMGSKSSIAKSSAGGSSLRARHTSPSRRKATTTSSSGKLAVDKGRLSSGQRK